MNYLPFCGYHFYGASTGTARASFASSYGLLESSPVTLVARRLYGSVKQGLVRIARIGSWA